MDKEMGYISIKDHRDMMRSLLVVMAIIVAAWTMTCIYAFGTIKDMTKTYFTTDYSYGTEIVNTNNSSAVIEEE